MPDTGNEQIVVCGIRKQRRSPLRTFGGRFAELTVKPPISARPFAPSMSSELESLEHRQLGQYRVISELGRGGMGIVHRAQHMPTGQLVALKTVRIPTRKAISALREEALALKRMAHSSVVRILDQGLSDEGLPWYAMELIVGRTLADLNAEIWQCQSGGLLDSTVTGRSGAPVNERNDYFEFTEQLASPVSRPKRSSEAANGHLPEVLTLYAKIASALLYIHSQGVVHRDLKPSNVLIREDGTPVLMDFGLVSKAFGSLGRESLGLGERTMGTLCYASPEQLAGESVDSRADLYSLGCMLFETLTGEPPMHLDRAGTVSRQHLLTPVPPPAEFVDVSHRLNDLVMRLLARSPKERTVSALDVLRDLTAIGRLQTSQVPVPAEEPPIYLYRPTIAGRKDALSSLSELRQRALGGHGSLALVGGESGIGKTFLATEVVRSALREQFQVVTGECAPIANSEIQGADLGGAPLHPFRPLFQAMADRCHEEGEGFTFWLFGGKTKLLAPYEPALAHLPGSESDPELEALAPEAAKRRLLDALTETLSRFAAERPLLLVLDDLQWADELSLRLLEALTPEFLGERSLLVLGTYRMEEAGPVLQRLSARPDITPINLGRLSEDTIASVASDMLGISSIPMDLARFLAERSNGNPFFMAEYLRAAANEQLFSRHSGQWRVSVPESASASYDTVSLPRSLNELILKRLQRLDETARAAAEAAAVLGREFEISVLARTLRADESTTLAVVDTLRRRQILENGPIGSVRFGHDLLRESTYERILPERRRELHRVAAQALEDRYAGSDELFTQHAALGRHWSMARVPERAYLHFRSAAERARAAFANQDAQAFYQAAIREATEGFADEPEREAYWKESLAVLYESLGDLTALAGKHVDARACFQRARDLLEESGYLSTGRLLRKQSKTFEHQSDYSESLHLLDLAHSALAKCTEREREAWWREWLDIQNNKIWVYYWTARLPPMAEAISQTRVVLDRHGSPAQRAQFYQLYSLLRMREERFLLSADTVALARLALEAIQGTNSQELPAVHFTFGFALLFHGDIAGAAVALACAHTEAERAGDLAVQTRVLTYQLMLHRRRGDIGAVRHIAEKTLAIATAGQLKHYIGAAEACLGWVALKQGNLQNAEERCSIALRVWDEAMPSSYPFRWLALWPLIAIGVEADDDSRVDGYARALLEPAQQRLPEEFALLLAELLAARSPTHRREVTHSLLHTASQHGFI